MAKVGLNLNVNRPTTYRHRLGAKMTNYRRRELFILSAGVELLSVTTNAQRIDRQRESIATRGCRRWRSY